MDIAFRIAIEFSIGIADYAGVTLIILAYFFIRNRRHKNHEVKETIVP